MKSAAATLQLEALSLLIAGRLGLHFPAARLRTMENALGQAARAAGFAQPGAFINALLRPDPEEELFDALVRELTVGETYFFRESAVFTAITEQFLPEWSRRWAGRMALPRFWSVGCCTGEEAYSLAIALERHGFPAPERAEILASDLNPHFLRLAREGIYRPWSFRGAPDWLRPAYFRPVDGERVEIRGDIRRAVRFQRLNLAGESYPSPENGTAAVDLILCRNVLMYFTPEQLGRAVRQLAACLADGGWLVVGGAETGHVEAPGLAPARFGDLTVFVKTAVRARAAVAVPARAHREFFVPPPSVAAPAPAVRHVASAPRRDEPAPSLDDARRAASSGDRAAALAVCERLLRVDRMNAAAHFVRASILLEQGQGIEAEAALRRALYLEPDFVAAHLAVAQAARAAGRAAVADRHLRTVLRLVSAMDPNTVVPETDGMTAGRMAETLALLIADRPGSAQRFVTAATAV